MTLGPALILLSLLDGATGWLWMRLREFGRVPLFYYLLHLPLLHVVAILFSFARYGGAVWLFEDLMFKRGALHPLPTGYGYGLPVVYAVWLSAILVLHPSCLWFGRIKKTHPNLLFRYL